jgi:hypothetical protein
VAVPVKLPEKMNAMLISDLHFRPCTDSSGDEFAVLRRHQATVWRHSNGTYTVSQLSKSGQCYRRNVDPLMAQTLVYHIINGGSLASPESSE